MTTNKLIQVTYLVLLMDLIFTSCEKLNLNKVSASFSVDKEAGYQPLVVKFNNTSENAVDYSWDFGDGTTSTETEPTHTFTTISITGSQTFIVTLTATGSKNSKSISTKEINVI
jgi:PKD repeat protein